MLFFMYGTLRKGYSAHNRLMNGATFVGPALTQGVRLGTSFFKPSREWALDGELWDVPDANVRALDAYEGHPLSWHRKEVPVRVHDDATERTAWCYFSPIHHS